MKKPDRADCTLQNQICSLQSAICNQYSFPVCRLGLATRGGTQLAAADVLYALERGINFLNWHGHADGLSPGDAFSTAVASLGARRQSVVVCVQFWARRTEDAAEWACS